MRNVGIVINEMYVEKRENLSFKEKSLEQIENELKCYLDLRLFDRDELRYCYRYKLKKDILDNCLGLFLREQLKNQCLKDDMIYVKNEYYLDQTYLSKNHQIYIEGYIFCKDIVLDEPRYLINLIQKSSTNPLAKAIYFN